MLIPICALSIGASNTDDGFPVREIPEDLLGDAEAIIRLDEKKFEVHSTSSATLEERWVCTILSSKADKYATFARSYDNLRKLKSIKGYLYDANGKQIKKLKKSDVVDQSYIQGFSLYEDDRIKIANLEHASYPYTVEFICEYEFDGLFYYPSWYPQIYRKAAVQNAKIDVIMPENMPLRFKEQNVSGVRTTTAEGKEIYSWEENNLAAFEYEPMSNPEEYVKKVMLAPSKFSVEGVEGDMSDWEAYGKFYASLNRGTRDLSEATKQKIRALTKDLKTDREKIAKVYEFLQEKTRYVSVQVGIGGIKPFPASTVDEKGYGDCKALSNYTKAMLKAIGIESHYTLVGADDHSPLHRDFPADYFNHVILSVPLEKDTIWLECTSQTEAFGYLSDFTGDRDVFVITPEGGKIWRTPSYGKSVNFTKRNAEVKINANGDANISAVNIFSTLQEGKRAHYCEASKEEQKKWLYEQIALSDFTIKDFSLKRHKSEFPYVEEQLIIEDPKFARVSGKRIFIEPNIFSKWDYILPTNEDRTRNVYLSNVFDFVDTDTINFELPQNYRVEYMPEPIDIESEFGHYQVQVEVENNIVKYIRKIEMNPGTYSKESYEELRDFLKEVTKHDKTKVVLVNNT